MDPKELAQKGLDIYNRKYKAKLEEEFRGKYVAIDVYSEDHFIGNTPEEAIENAIARKPEGFFHLIRIGYDGVYRISTFLPHEDYSII